MNLRDTVQRFGRPVTGALSAVAGLITIGLFVADRTSTWSTQQNLYTGISFLLCVVFYLLFLLVRHKAAPSRVFLLAPPFGSATFFASLIEQIIVDLSKKSFDVVLCVPASDTERNFREITRPILEHASAYSGGVVIPSANAGEQDILRLLSTFKKPIVLVDRDPFGGKDLPANVGYVGYNSKVGGELAAKAVWVAMEHRCIENPTVLILMSSTQQISRQAAFKAEMTAHGVSANDMIERDGKFDRSLARRVMREFLESEQNRRADGPLVVFCTNDEMALGVNDEIVADFLLNTKEYVIVGYDGIDEARAVIEEDTSALCATVVQSSSQLANQAVLMFSELLEGDSPADDRKQELDPTLYPGSQ